MDPCLPVRSAVGADYPRYAALFPELGAGDPTPSQDTFVDRLAATTIVVELGGDVAGYAYYQLLDDTLYVRNVVTDPARRRRGVGRTLMRELERHARAAGLTRWCLNVGPDNTAARSLYEAFGMTAAYASVALRFAWSVAAGLPAEAIDTRPLPSSDDLAVEARFALPGGLIDDTRKRAGHHAIGAYAAAEAVGVACFSPSFPGAFPFRVARLGVARPLLDACHARALPEPDYMQIVVEDDDVLAAALIAGGAIVRTELVHYRGELSARTPPA
jgi:GNAT superfamily N-acetyltransferase